MGHPDRRWGTLAEGGEPREKVGDLGRRWGTRAEGGGPGQKMGDPGRRQSSVFFSQDLKLEPPADEGERPCRVAERGHVVRVDFRAPEETMGVNARGLVQIKPGDFSSTYPLPGCLPRAATCADQQQQQHRI